ncbi:hypothetical protein SPB21_24880 [Leptothoe sp. ISB3NOV94-8A]
MALYTPRAEALDAGLRMGCDRNPSLRIKALLELPWLITISSVTDESMSFVG